jgi:hypothetical protein
MSLSVVARFSSDTVGGLGSETSSSSFAFTGINASQGSAIIVCIACDNNGTTDGDLSEVTSVSDDAGNPSYTKIKEWTNGQGAAAGGATVAAYYCVVRAILNNSNTITVQFANAIAAKCAQVYTVSPNSGNLVSVAGSVQTEVQDNADAGSLTISGLTNKQYLFLRVIASETDGYGITTATTGYLSLASRSGSGGSEKIHISCSSEYRILIGTGDSSNPTLSDTTVDLASIYFALEEIFTPVARVKIIAQAVNRASRW